MGLFPMGLQLRWTEVFPVRWPCGRTRDRLLGKDVGRWVAGRLMHRIRQPWRGQGSTADLRVEFGGNPSAIRPGGASVLVLLRPRPMDGLPTGITSPLDVQTARNEARWNGPGEPRDFARLRFLRFGRPRGVSAQRTVGKPLSGPSRRRIGPDWHGVSALGAHFPRATTSMD